VSRDADDQEFEGGPKPAAPRPGLSLKARAVGLLSRREHSRLELERKLAPHAETPEVLAQLLDELARAGWQSDARFTQGWVHRKAPGQGAARIVQDLKQQGIAPEALLQVRAELKETEFARAQAVWTRKFSSTLSSLSQTTSEASKCSAPKLSQAEYAKQGRFLASRGFSMDIICRVLKQTSLQNDEGGDENNESF
jgi:regulatory protein